jgi:hypothetical protein
VDRPVEYSELQLVKDEAGVVQEVRQVLVRESTWVDGANLGLVLRRGERWFAHLRTRVVGTPGDSLFVRGARAAGDVTLGFRGKKLDARLTGLNVTGTDYLRSRADGGRPDLKPEWLLLLGYRWGL